MNHQLTSAHITAIAIVVITILAVSSTYVFSPLLSFFVFIVICIVIYLLRALFYPSGYGANKVRLYSLYLVTFVASTFGTWGAVVNTLVKAFSKDPRIMKFAPWLSEVNIADEPSVGILILVLGTVFIVNYFLVERNIAGNHPLPILKEFPGQSFAKKLESFCSALQQHIITTDRESNWSPTYYADLEAEVEIVSIAGIVEHKEILDLQKAIKKNKKSRSFLVLGDPGAGKSVALRKLAKDMLSQISSSGRIPIYINLREWLPSSGARVSVWSETNKPTIKDLEAFVLENLKARGDVFTEDFLDEYFRALWENGRLFFIFDSFDEIPELLDVNEESWLINALSDVISRFISSNINSRGILSSRIFRRPTDKFMADKILEIRPMSEQRILQALARFKGFNVSLKNKLFKERTDLGQIAKNPLLMTLLGEWVNDKHDLPQNQAELYQNYIKGRLEKCSDKIIKYGFTQEEVLAGATEIAWFVFKSPEYGLEAPIHVINDQFQTNNISSIIDILSYARIARVTVNEPKSFAFVHRRFLEYLVTTRLLTHSEDLNLEHIPTDSRGRDALVLYAQICDFESAKKLAELCWKEIEMHLESSHQFRLRAIHSLRFLIDSFRSRLDAMSSFQREYSELLKKHISQGNDLITAKICLEGSGLLNETDAIPILNQAMNVNNSWLQETAFRACRHLPKMESKLEKLLINYVINIPILQFLKSKKTLSFSLSLSESLKGVHRTVAIKNINLWAAICSFPIALIINPILITLAIALYIQILFISWFWGYGMDPLFALLKEKQSKLDHTKKTDIHEKTLILSNFVRKVFLAVNKDYLISFRQLWAAVLIFHGLALISASIWPMWFDTHFLENMLFWDISQKHVILFSCLDLIFGCLIVDWLKTQLIFKTIVYELIAEPKHVRFILFFVALAIPMIYEMFIVFDWLKNHGYEKVILVCGGGAMLVISLHVMKGLLKNLRTHYYDYKVYKGISYSNIMPREKICSILEDLKSVYWKLRFVRDLSQKNILASGDWPIYFKLSVIADIPITELAKLEERWLSLDR